MMLAPRLLVNFWAALQVARFGRRIKTSGYDVSAQHTAFARLMTQTAATQFGRQYEITARTTYAQFRETVPPGDYHHFQPLIARMVGGETDVLASGRCRFFVGTAGATGPEPKLLPVPEPMLAHYRHGLRDALFHYAQRVGHSGIYLGRHLHIGGSTALIESDGTYRTGLDGMLTLCLDRWAEANLRSPPRPIARMPDGAEKIAATARAMLGRDVTLVAGSPAITCALALAVREAGSVGKQRMIHLQALWPNLECYLHTGAPLGLFGDTLRTSLGPTVKFHEVYAAAEGIFAAQDGGSPTALRLLADAGVFFEFLPLASYHEATFTKAGSLCLPLEHVQTGTEYVLLVTTPAGLCRYVTGDIVRFVSVEPHRLQFVGRTALQLNAFGERVAERDIFESLQAVCSRNGWQATAFHVAPYEQRLGPGQVANVHEWWLELGTHTMKTPMANVLGPEFDAELARRCPEYAVRRSQNLLGPPQIRLVMPGVFEQWAQEQRKTAATSKMPCCRSDRLIADQLAALAPFHQPALASFKVTGATLPR